MQPARIPELLEPFLGPEDQRPKTQDLFQHISTYIDILMRWNARINLTAIRDEEQIVTRHFGESLFAARHLFPLHEREGHDFSHATKASEKMGALAPEVEPAKQNLEHQVASRLTRGRAALQGRVTGHEHNRALAPEAVADIGSGAGFPGIPLKLWAPHIHLTLIESNHKKATFLREVARTLTLTDINILSVRAETLPPATFDLVTLRAVERFEAILPIASRLVAPGGRVALLIGRSQLQPAQKGLPNLRWSQPLTIPASSSRVLLVGSPS